MKKQIQAALIVVIVFFGMIGIAYGLKHANREYTYSDYPLAYEKEINAAAKKYKVDKALIYGIIKTESNFDPDAESGAGALGLMQLMPSSFEWLQTYYKDENNYEFDDTLTSLCDGKEKLGGARSQSPAACLFYL